jgi:protein-tyrosine phosphatase
MEVKVLFICMGNICRSPTAQGVFEKLVQSENLVKRIYIDSAGTHAYHIGEPPDPRAQDAARRRGIDLSQQRARKVVIDDFEIFDYLIPMDNENLNSLVNICSTEHQSKITLFMQHAPEFKQTCVPDPYYGGLNGFESVLDMVEAASEGLLVRIKKERGF